MKLVELTLTGFSQELASSSPAPGGGSASAYAGALGASLYMMVLAVEATKAEDKTHHDKLIAELKPYRDSLLALVDDDASAFEKVMQAFKLPKNTDDEKSVRREAIQSAMIHAAEIPLQTMSVCLSVLQMADEVYSQGAKAAASDVAVGTRLLVTAVDCARLNVEINLPSIKDEVINQKISKEKNRIWDQTIKISERINQLMSGSAG